MIIKVKTLFFCENFTDEYGDVHIMKLIFEILICQLISTCMKYLLCFFSILIFLIIIHAHS